MTKTDKKDKNPENGIDDGGKEKKEKEKPELPPVPYLHLFRFASPRSKIFAVIALIAALACGFSMPLMIILFGRVIDAMVGQGTDFSNVCGGTQKPPDEIEQEMIEIQANFMGRINSFSLNLTILAVATLICCYIFISLFNIVSEDIVFQVRRIYLESLLRQNVGWYDVVEDKNFVSRITEDLVKIQEATGEKVGLCVFFCATTFISLGNAFYHGWLLALVVLSSAPILTISTGIIAAVHARLARDEQTSYAKAGNVAEEALTNVKTVMAFSGVDKELERYEEGLLGARAAAKKRGAVSAFGVGLMWGIIYASYALAFWYGTRLVLEDRCKNKEDQKYATDTLIIVFFSVIMGAYQIGQTASYFEAFAVGKGSAALIYSIIDRVPEIDSYSEEGRKPAQRSKGALAFHNLKFNYPSRPEVDILKDFNLTVESGQTVALVGHSGCGKSTVLQLLQRFYDPLNGKICVDGDDIKDIHLGWLRSQIGVVSQEPILFNTTILENIQYGRANVTLKEAEEACRQSNAHGFISKLPNGYNTIVGDRGAHLSGGQKQRIAIARALVRNPAILLLDEATSALDTQSESVVQAALDRARQGRTTLIVAHRLSTIRSADLVVAIGDGAVSEQGTHKELLHKKGLYYSLVLAQMQGRGEVVDFDEDEEETAEKQRMLEKTLEETRRKSFTALDDDEVMPETETVAEALMDEKDLAKQAPITRLLKLNKPEWKEITVAIISSIIQGGMMPAFAIIFGEYLNVLAKPDEEAKKDANLYAILFLVLGIISFTAQFSLHFLFSLSGEALTRRLRKMTFHAMLKQELGWYDDPNNNVGALCSRLSGDASHVQGATGSRLGIIFESTSTLTIATALAMYYKPKLGAVALCFVPLVVFATYFQMKMVLGHELGDKKAVDEASKIAVQAVGNIRTVASLGMERTFVQMYNSKLVKTHLKIIQLAHLRGVVFGIAQSAMFFAYAVVMYYGGQLVQNEAMPFENVFKVCQALILGTMVVGQSMALTPNYNKAKVAGARIIRLLDRKPKIDTASNVGLHIRDSTGSVLFDQVAFSYPTRPGASILRSLSFAVVPGQSIALVGPSGCGKSTCIQLILRYYDPISGSVNFDSQNVSGLNLDSLRSQMAIVAQEPALFDRTIGQNIAYGDNSRLIPMDEIISAAQQANIHSFIASLPSGYETRVGEMGTQLSGGQKQRVAIARALIRRPKLILLDEATSALDTESEAVVQAALDSAAEGRSSITIAHRLSSIQNVDRIIVINQGQLYESGTHEELLRKEGLYFRLWSMQGQLSGNTNNSD